MNKTATVTAQRRNNCAKQVDNGVIFLTARPLSTQSRDVHYSPYVPNHYLYYLSGCEEPHTHFLMWIENGSVKEAFLFCRAYDKQLMQWNGDYLTPDNAYEKTGIHGLDSALLEQYLLTFIQNEPTLYYLPGDNAQWDKWIGDKFGEKRLNNRHNKIKMDKIVDVSTIIDSSRLIKDSDECIAIEHACQITCNALTEAIKNAKQASMEYEIEALLTYHYTKHGATHAFSPIVASGKNACCLHYTANNGAIDQNKMLLIDTGCRIDGYCSDITRTFAMDGIWQGAAKEVYELVLLTQKKLIEAVKVDVGWVPLNDMAIEMLADGLIQLNLCQGSIEDVIEQKQYKPFYMHSIGHSLGLDVHDVGSYPKIQAGMVMTIEPGLYIPNDDTIPKAFRGIGVRIEDDILIQQSTNTVLTASVPKEIDDIINLMAR